MNAEAEPAPRLGQHAVEMLLEAGYSAADIDHMIADGVTSSGAPAGV